MIIRRESIVESAPLVSRLLVSQWEETEMYQDKMVLNPNWDMYMQMEQQGVAKMFTAVEDDEIVGYAVYFVSEHPHHKGVIMADSDIVYISPEYRGTGLAYTLYSESEKLLKEDGVHLAILRMKERLRFDSLAEKLGYEKEEVSFAKWIGE